MSCKGTLFNTAYHVSPELTEIILCLSISFSSLTIHLAPNCEGLKKDIEKRQDIELVVKHFYEKMRNEPTLGPVFMQYIKDWDKHEALISDFWETKLFFGVKKYRGQAAQAHVKPFREYSLDQSHFAIWLRLWLETIRTEFEGENAERLINLARNMSFSFWLHIWHEKNKS